MSLILESGEVAFTGNGTRRWSSNDKNLMLLQAVSSSFSINAVDRRQTTSLITSAETVLGTIPSNATFVIGHTILNGRRRSIGGDQIVVMGQETMQNASSYTASTSTGVTTAASIIWFNVFISGTQLKALVSYRFPSAAKTLYAGATVQVRAMVGGFEF